MIKTIHDCIEGTDVIMWNGKITDELKELVRQYGQMFSGAWPHGYDELNYDAMTYDEFVVFIKECLATGKEMPEVVP